MAKKTQHSTVTVPLIPDDDTRRDIFTDPELSVPSKEEAEEANALSDFQSRFAGKDFKVRIEKYNKVENEWEIVNNCKLDGFDPLQTLKPYGGGRYRLTVLNSGGKYVEGGREYVRLAEAVKADAPAIESPKDPLDSPVVKMVLGMMAQQQATLTGLMTAMVSTPKPAETTSIPQLIDALAKLNGLGGNKDKGSALKETLELLTTAKALLPEPESSSGGIMSEIREAVQAAGALGLLRSGRQPRANPPQEPAAEPAPQALGGTMTIPTAREAAPMLANPIADSVRKYIPIFLSKAKRQEDAADAADFLIEELYADIIPCIIENYHPIPFMKLSELQVAEAIVEKAKDPAEVERVFAFAPELVEHRAWVVTVINKAVEELTKPEPQAAPEVAS